MLELFDSTTGLKIDFLNPLRMVKGETRRLSFQLKENSVPKNIAGFTFKFAAKARFTDTVYAVAVVNGVIADAATGTFYFDVTPAAAMNGVCEIAMYSAGAKTVLTQPRGQACEVAEDIID